MAGFDQWWSRVELAVRGFIRSEGWSDEDLLIEALREPSKSIYDRKLQAKQAKTLASSSPESRARALAKSWVF